MDFSKTSDIILSMASLTRSEKGFSLIEVLIALAILSSSLMVISTAWSTTMQRMRKMKQQYQAAYLLDYKVADFERQYKDKIMQLPEAEEGTFEDLGAEYKDYTWAVQTKKFEMPDLTPILAQRKQGADVMLTTMMGQLSDYFRDAAREVTVTITYTYRKKQIKYSATTFIVDFNQQLPMPNLGGGGMGAGGGGG